MRQDTVTHISNKGFPVKFYAEILQIAKTDSPWTEKIKNLNMYLQIGESKEQSELFRDTYKNWKLILFEKEQSAYH